jgi:hypothetical protein
MNHHSVNKSAALCFFHDPLLHPEFYLRTCHFCTIYACRTERRIYKQFQTIQPKEVIIVKTMNKLMAGKLTRRTFLNCLGKAAIVSALIPAFGCSQPAKKKTEDVAQNVAPPNWKPSQRTPKVVVRDITPDRLLLKNGLVVDGTGQKAFYGDVLVNADRPEGLLW